MFKIGEFSQISRVPVKTLRYYAEIGLLAPASVDASTGYRYYTADQLPRLNRILALKDLGLSLAQVSDLLDEDLSAEQLRGIFRLKQGELQAQIEAEQARLARVAARLNFIEKEGQMPEQDIIIKTLDRMHVLSVRHTFPKPEEVGQVFGMAYMALQNHGINPTSMAFTMYHDAEFKSDELDVSIVFPVEDSVPEKVNVGEGLALIAHDLPAIEHMATIVHKGTYERFDESYNALGQWIEANGYRIAGPAREIYITPGDSDEAITEIQYPVEKLS